jgi:hypothetical protein
MAIGLEITEKQFLKLPQGEQHKVMYQNEVAILREVRAYRMHQRIQYVLLSAVSIGLGFLAEKVLMLLH